MIKKLLDKIASSVEDEQQIVLIDPNSLNAQKPEPDMRIIGMFCDVAEDKVAEIIHAMLYLNEVNKLEKVKFLTDYLHLVMMQEFLMNLKFLPT